MITGRSTGLALLVALATGCSSTSALDDACVPELTCNNHLELVKEPAGCTTCANCSDNWGSCAVGGFACKQGQLDMNVDSAGCETAAADVHAEYVAHAGGDASGVLSINKDRMSATITPSLVAIDAADPSCVPSANISCAYTLQALQLSIGDFTTEPADPLTWSNGTLTVTGPLAASDDGSGAVVPAAPVVLAFNVSSSSGHRLAVASGTVSLGVVFDYTVRAPVSVQLEAKGFGFGGYDIDDIVSNGPLSAR